ncbi:hypothetical protein DIPPA_14370 [Diplonema papillatum]|nr:hypothetical protein DIPPA_14370 [Diplonema papillatum]
MMTDSEGFLRHLQLVCLASATECPSIACLRDSELANRRDTSDRTSGSNPVDDRSEREKVAEAKASLREWLQTASSEEKELVAKRDAVSERNREMERELERRKAESQRRAAADGVLLEKKLNEVEEELELAKIRLERVVQEGKNRAKRYAEEAAELQDETVGAANEVKRCRIDKTRGDAENVLILRLLHAEVKKWRSVVTELEAAASVQKQEEAKNTILIGLLNTQLLATRAEESSLRASAFEHREQTVKARDKLTAAATQRDALARTLTDLDEVVENTRDEHRYIVSRHRAAEQRLHEQVATVEAELEELRQQSERSCTRGRACASKRQQEHSDLAAGVSKHTVLACDARKALLENELFAFDTDIRGQETITRLNIERDTLAKTAESSVKKNFEVQIALDNDISLIQVKLAAVVRQRTVDAQEFAIKEAEVSERIKVLQETTTTVRNVATQKERENFETITKLAAANECLKREAKDLQKRIAQVSVSEIEERVKLATEIAKAKRAAQGAKERLDEATQRHDEACTELVNQRDEMAQGDYRLVEAAGDEVESLRSSEQSLLKEKDSRHKREETLRQQSAIRDRYVQDRYVAFEAERKSLKSELASLTRVSEKLEEKVRETYSYKATANQNGSLEDEIKGFKAKIRQLKNTVSTMNVEKGLLDGFKSKVLAECNKTQLQQLQGLEQGRLRLVPLLKELLSTARRHSITHPSIAAAEQAALEMGISSFAAPM